MTKAWAARSSNTGYLTASGLGWVWAATKQQDPPPDPPRRDHPPAKPSTERNFDNDPRALSIDAPRLHRVVGHSDAVMARAEADLAAGDWRMAAQRLRGHLVAEPACELARAQLVQIYRTAGNPQEAGRWGYLLADVATDDELSAFEAGCSARLTPDWTASMMRRAIKWPRGITPTTPGAEQRLDQLDTRADEEDRARKAALAPAWWRWIDSMAAKVFPRCGADGRQI